jgi:hypothetical protein
MPLYLFYPFAIRHLHLRGNWCKKSLHTAEGAKKKRIFLESNKKTGALLGFLSTSPSTHSSLVGGNPINVVVSMARREPPNEEQRRTARTGPAVEGKLQSMQADCCSRLHRN